MTIARSVAEVLERHVTLELECIDRMYLNAYIPILQTEGGVAYFFREQRGHRFPSSSLMAPMTEAFVASIERFAEQEGIEVVRFEKGQRKEELAQAYRRKFTIACGRRIALQPELDSSVNVKLGQGL